MFLGYPIKRLVTKASPLECKIRSFCEGFIFAIAQIHEYKSKVEGKFHGETIWLWLML